LGHRLDAGSFDLLQRSAAPRPRRAAEGKDLPGGPAGAVPDILYPLFRRDGVPGAADPLQEARDRAWRIRTAGVNIW
jgi:hypothetical protein